MNRVFSGGFFKMSHEIETMMYAGSEGRPWHGLGTEVQDTDLYNWPLACQKAGLDWDVELVPLVTHDTGAKVEHKAVRRSSDGRTLGVVGPRYTPLANKDAFRWFAPWLDTKEASLSAAGSLREGSRIWVLARLNRDPMEIAKGDIVQKYLLLSHGHDGSLAVRCGFTAIRAICANTLAMAHNSDASRLIRIKHSKSVLENLEAVRETISIANERFEATAEQYRRLVNTGISQQDVRSYVYRVLEIQDESKASTRIKNIAQKMIDLAETGRGNDLPSVRGSLWASFNGVTQYLAYDRGSNKESRLDSLWFGDSANLNKKALDVALAMAV
jgi:phage/plasmid-like protein (TIGR03299 family)